MSRPIWQFSIDKEMVAHLDSNSELGLFFSALEDAIQEICQRYEVQPWEVEREDNA